MHKPPDTERHEWKFWKPKTGGGVSSKQSRTVIRTVGSKMHIQIQDEGMVSATTVRGAIDIDIADITEFSCTSDNGVLRWFMIVGGALFAAAGIFIMTQPKYSTADDLLMNCFVILLGIGAFAMGAFWMKRLYITHKKGKVEAQIISNPIRPNANVNSLIAFMRKYNPECIKEG